MDESLQVSVQYVPLLSELLASRRTVVVKSGMGTGKSRSFLECVPMFSRVLILANRVSVLRNLGQRGNVKLYSEVKDIRAEDKLLCTVESLHKLLDADGALPLPYSLVIVDELPATLAQFLSTTVKNKRRNFEVFSHVIRSAENFAGYAADLCKLDVDVVRMLRGEVTEWTNTKTNSPGTLKFDDKDTVCDTVREWLASGRNVYVGSDSKRLLKSLIDSLDESVNARMYSADSTEAERRELSDPVTHWTKFQFVGATPIITHGVDFSAEHFDYQAYLCSGRSIVPRAIVQSLRRVRKTTSGLTLFALPGRLPSESMEYDLFGTTNLLKYVVEDGRLTLDSSDPLTLLAQRSLDEMKTRASMMEAVSEYWKEAGGHVEVDEAPELTLPDIGFTEESPGVWKSWVMDGETLSDGVTLKMKAVKRIVKSRKMRMVRESRKRIGQAHKSLYAVYETKQ